MNKPTQEQIKEVWEWCGLKYTTPYWIDTFGKIAFYGETETELKESVNLNNLFKYAVPKLKGRYKLEGTGGYHFANVWKDRIAYVEIKDTDPALALFWAIWEVMEHTNPAWEEE